MLREPYTEIEKDSLNQLYSRYHQLILLWETVLTISSILLFYLIIHRYWDKEKKYREFLELTTLTISHKFGNFLATMKVNVEIIKSTNHTKSLNYIEDYLSRMEDDIKTIIEILKRGTEEKIERVKVGDKIQQIVEKIDINDRKVIQSIKTHKVVETDTNILENILFILLHNSYKYSDSLIHIKLTRHRVLIIRNDIKLRRIEGGSGIGLTLAERLCQLNGWKLKIKKSKNHFTVFVCF